MVVVVVGMKEEMEGRMVEELVEMEVVMEGEKDGRPRERHGKLLGCWKQRRRKKE